MTNNIIIWPQGMRRDHCRYCGVPFNEIPESMSIPGVCEFCAERKNAIGDVNHLKSVFVNMDSMLHGWKMPRRLVDTNVKKEAIAWLVALFVLMSKRRHDNKSTNK